MLANKLLQTWTNPELYEMYLGLGGQLSVSPADDKPHNILG